jgi:hypothetical protein
MAQDRFVNLTLDPSAPKKPDNVDHRHGVVSGSAAASGDVTLSFDSTKVTSKTILDSVVRGLVESARALIPK